MKMYPALLIPFDRSGRVDVAALEQHTRNLLSFGADGFVLLGTMGEFPDLEMHERETIISTVRSVASDCPLMVGIGGVGLAACRDYARQAEELGADELLALPPIYWKLPEDKLFDFFEGIVENTRLPVMLYDLPYLAGTSLPASLIRRLAMEDERISGVKLSANDLEKLHASVAVKRKRPGFRVMIGHREFGLVGAMNGADGLIGELINVVPELHAAFSRAVNEGDWPRALMLHERILSFSVLSTLTVPPMLGLKVATDLAVTPMGASTRIDRQVDEEAVEQARQRTRELLEALKQQS